MAAAAVAVAHVGLAAVWLGSMLYSLLIVQPRLARRFGADDDMLEELLTLLGAGNRRPVLAIIVALLVTAAERPAHRATLRRHALAMVALVGGAFVAAVAALAIS